MARKQSIEFPALKTLSIRAFSTSSPGPIKIFNSLFRAAVIKTFCIYICRPSGREGGEKGAEQWEIYRLAGASRSWRSAIYFCAQSRKPCVVYTKYNMCYSSVVYIRWNSSRTIITCTAPASSVSFYSLSLVFSLSLGFSFALNYMFLKVNISRSVRSRCFLFLNAIIVKVWLEILNRLQSMFLSFYLYGYWGSKSINHELLILYNNSL